MNSPLNVIIPEIFVQEGFHLFLYLSGAFFDLFSGNLAENINKLLIKR